jgi:hypothetical protein
MKKGAIVHFPATIALFWCLSGSTISNRGKAMSFRITDHIEFNSSNRAACPCCANDGKVNNTNLSLHPEGAYKCFRGCTPADIREALGNPKPQQIPAALAGPTEPIKSATISPQKVREAHETLMASNGPAKLWLHNRGLTDEILARHQIGIARSKVGNKHLPSISIPLPNADGTAYYRKRESPRGCWESDLPAEYKPWSQSGIPARTWFTWRPAEALQTYLCEGEWDAMILGHEMRKADLPIAVATFTCGCGNLPPQSELDQLLGEVIIFYDRNDKPLKNGKLPGDEARKRSRRHWANRARIAQVPMMDSNLRLGYHRCLVWGFKLHDIIAAAEFAKPYAEPIVQKSNPLRDRMQWNDDLLDTAPDYTEWLVPDLLTADELFLLARGHVQVRACWP